ncbi:unnamed protein product [Acanthoscelides obtectus]|uniref:Uncharacterized protein n=1 Tax=Acanthoscelides obtectus TaxID=200917 RepID=A0A9P0L090_ACAOB|nr:unnamed protein product [Acanthoscelides obtectus]CAK1655909.1 hypothetical protein AOBTE_LOCUS19432 [Acanthoscelides obtectus]
MVDNVEDSVECGEGKKGRQKENTEKGEKIRDQDSPQPSTQEEHAAAETPTKIPKMKVFRFPKTHKTNSAKVFMSTSAKAPDLTKR